jgi:hypothetical protein
LRIYNRLLSDAEVQALSTMPPANIAPVVVPGANQTVIWPAIVNLNGAEADDGKPNPPGAVITTWSQVSGSGTVAFGNVNALSTTASFSAPGIYTLQLAANDGQAQTVGNVVISAVTLPTPVVQLLPGSIRVSWPTNCCNWRLQFQTNSFGVGMTTNWIDVPGSANTNVMSFPMNTNIGSAFFRMVFP